jgi:LPPG:FO 2-phospho-L-lactate transferase
MKAADRVTVLAGGYGGAKLSHGLALASESAVAHGAPGIDLSIVANTGDDLELHGLFVSPDLDTLLYTLAGLANEATGWGVRDETWSSAAMLARFGAPTWFQLGDRDLGTNLWRTARLREGTRLTEVTAHLAASLGVSARLLPMTEARVRTELLTAGGWLEFQEYFVHRHHADAVTALRYVGAESAAATPEVLEAITGSVLLVLAPSNPYLSIGAILAVPGISDAIRSAPAQVVAVSPIVAGTAIRGPADRLFQTLGGEASALGVARLYQEQHPGLLDALVIDTLDADLAGPVRATGLDVLVTDTVMHDHADRERLATTLLGRWLAPD